MNKTWLSLSLIFLLSGCVPAVLMTGGATAGGSVVYDHRPVNIQVRDRDITQISKNRIADTPALKNAHLEVATFNGIVLMVGQALSTEQRDLAYQLVSTVPFVKRVYNEVTVSGTNGALERANDDWITAKIKTALLSEKDLSSTGIKVVTESGIVYLMGIVSPGQGNATASVASRITGVKKVVKVFEYLN